MSTDGWTCRWCPLHTIENRADEISGEPDLLQKVQVVRDLWRIGIIGPGLKVRVSHGSSVCKGWEISTEGEIEGGEGGGGSEIRLGLVGRRDWGYKGPCKVNLRGSVTATSGKPTV